MTKSQKIEKVQKKIKYWERLINRIDSKMYDISDWMSDLERCLFAGYTVAGTKLEITCVCRQKLEHKVDFLKDVMVALNEKKDKYLQFRENWKTKLLKLTDPRTPEEINNSWDAFWSSLPQKRAPKIRLEKRG